MENLLVNVKEFIEKVEKNEIFDNLEFIDVNHGWSDLDSQIRSVVNILNDGHLTTTTSISNKNLNTEYKVFKEATDTQDEKGYYVLTIPEGYTLDTLIEKVREEAKVVADYVVNLFNESYKHTELIFSAVPEVTPKKSRKEYVVGLNVQVIYTITINK